VPPNLGTALGLAVHAVRREGWLLAVGLAVGGLRRVLTWPAFAVAWALLVEAAFRAAREQFLDPFGAWQDVVATATSPRLLALVGGLWLAGVLAGAALRIAWLAGAIPALGGALAGLDGGTDRFAAGVAYGFPRVLATAVLGLVLEVAGALGSVGLAGSALVLAVWTAGGVPPALAAAAVALALTLALLVPVALSAAVDAAVARAALLGEGPGAALAGAARRFLLRPGAFLLGAVVAGVAAAFAPASVEASGGVLGGAPGVPAIVLLGPQLVLAVLAGLIAAAVDLAWLATVAVLACGEDRGR
jgi:hypothetical protein